MTDEVSFIHAADLHLDSPFKGLAHVPDFILQEMQESTFKALNRLVQTAIDKKVDFVLLVGDLFDNEKQSLKAQVRLRQAFEQLEKHHIKVYMSYGNHDHIEGNVHPMSYPDNVFIFPNEGITDFVYQKNGKDQAAIYGFSYETQAVVERKVNEYSITDSKIPFHIATLHGSLQTNTEHDTYAPFQISELQNTDFDYWALGHIHKRTILQETDPTIIYPGNIQARHRKESGEKGCYYVKLRNQSAADLSFVPLHTIEFKEVELDVSECTEVYQLETFLQQKLQELLPDTTSQFIYLTLTSDHQLLHQLDKDRVLEDMISLLNETLMNQENWHYIANYRIQENTSISYETLYKGDHFVGVLLRQTEDTEIQTYLQELYQHKQARRYLDSLTEEEAQSIAEEARELLVTELLVNRGE
ncbi:metallophosphoesterase family protein [Oceanobacillus halotolerans]|uniref:metallophosphoesterase family protein n=1 Tax=Oceanobacillus halotolerans TaxID=2663380 RepID=UPI0013D90D1D|nr:DNA repair exonuclease [Oceanobacillus halotolerans]